MPTEMKGVIRTATGVALAALALLTPVAHAARSWGEARPLQLEPFAVAIDERGFAIAVGERGGGLVGARRTPRRGFGDTFAVASDRRGEPAIAFTDRTATIAFSRADGSVSSRQVEAEGARTPPRVLWTEDDGRVPGELTLSGLSSGPLLAWWIRLGDKYMAFSPTLQIARAEGMVLQPARSYDFRQGSAAVAVEPDGSALVASAVFGSSYAGGAPEDHLNVAQAADDGTLASPQTVTDRPARIGSFAVDVGQDGSAVVAWKRYTGDIGADVLASRRPAGGTFGRAQVLSSHERAVEQLQVAVTDDGDPLVAWLAREEDDCYFCSRLLLAEPDGDEPVRLASGRGERVQQFALAADGLGGATLAWATNPRTRADGLISARAITRTERLGRIQRLNAGDARPRSLALAAGARGDAVVAWTREEGSALAARRPAGR